jgi:hypothetical protein
MPVSTGGDGCCDFGILAFAGVLICAAFLIQKKSKK